MAEAFFNHYAEGIAQGFSAGTLPAGAINTDVVMIMNEVGIDISSKQPKILTTEMIQWVDRVITMGCSTENVCPATFIATEDWGMEDPEGKTLEVVRRIRDQIKAMVMDLIQSL